MIFLLSQEVKKAYHKNDLREELRKTMQEVKRFCQNIFEDRNIDNKA